MTIGKSRHVENRNFSVSQQFHVGSDKPNVGHHEKALDDVIEVNVIEAVAYQTEANHFVVLRGCLMKRDHVTEGRKALNKVLVACWDLHCVKHILNLI